MEPSRTAVDVAQLKAAWAAYVEGGQLAPGLDPLVAASWRRCSPRLNPQGNPQWVYASSSMVPAPLTKWITGTPPARIPAITRIV